MSDFGDHFPDQEYQKIVGLGNKLGENRDLTDWEIIRPVISDMCRDSRETGGRPHHDELLMIKILILAGWHGVSDYEMELPAIDRVSFRHFPKYPEKVPDRSTLWLFRERLTSKGKSHLIREELRRQSDEQGYSIKRGTILDATVVMSDPGHTKADRPPGG